MCERNLKKFDPSRHQPPMPHFSDFQVYGPHLYAMSRNALYQIGKESGRVEHIFYFRIQGRSLEASEEIVRRFIDPPGYATLAMMKPAVNFPFFRVLDNGTLVLAYLIETFDYSLWQASEFLPPKKAR